MSGLFLCSNKTSIFFSEVQRKPNWTCLEKPVVAVSCYSYIPLEVDSKHSRVVFVSCSGISTPLYFAIFSFFKIPVPCKFYFRIILASPQFLEFLLLSYKRFCSSLWSVYNIVTDSSDCSLYPILNCTICISVITGNG